MKITVVGAGAWGTALAIGACAHPGAPHQVTLWARDQEQARTMHGQRLNQRYLPQQPLPLQTQAIFFWFRLTRI